MDFPDHILRCQDCWFISPNCDRLETAFRQSLHHRIGLFGTWSFSAAHGIVGIDIASVSRIY